MQPRSISPVDKLPSSGQLPVEQTQIATWAQRLHPLYTPRHSHSPIVKQAFISHFSQYVTSRTVLLQRLRDSGRQQCDIMLWFPSPDDDSEDLKADISYEANIGMPCLFLHARHILPSGCAQVQSGVHSPASGKEPRYFYQSLHSFP